MRERAPTLRKKIRVGKRLQKGFRLHKKKRRTFNSSAIAANYFALTFTSKLYRKRYYKRKWKKKSKKYIFRIRTWAGHKGKRFWLELKKRVRTRRKRLKPRPQRFRKYFVNKTG